jgi:hypothetical protein
LVFQRKLAGLISTTINSAAIRAYCSPPDWFRRAAASFQVRQQRQEKKKERLKFKFDSDPRQAWAELHKIESDQSSMRQFAGCHKKLKV